MDKEVSVLFTARDTTAAAFGAVRKSLGSLSSAFEGVEKRFRMVGREMRDIGAGMSLAITAPVVLMGKEALDTFGEFEAGMNRVGAASNANGDQLDKIQKLALSLGETTKFSALEASQAMENLIKNGLSVEQVLNGATAASMKLAAASGAALPDAADLTTDTMAAFKKEVGDLDGVVDQVVGTMTASKFGFDDYRLAIAQAGGVAGALGVEFEDMNAALAGTSSLFASGSDAGTSFKTFLTRLVPASDSAAKMMQDYNLQFYDGAGAMKSMADIAENLKTSIGSLSEEQQTNVLNTLFGVDGMRTAIGLMRQGEDGINSLKKTIGGISSADQANALMKGWKGALEQMNGAFETMSIELGENMAPVATQVANALGQVAQWVSALPEPVQTGAIAFAALAAAVGPLVASLGLVALGIGAIGVPVAAAVVGITALAAGAIALSQNWDAVKTSFPQTAAVIETAMAVISTTVSGLITQLGLVAQYVGQLFAGDLKGAAETVRQIFDNLGQTLLNVAQIIFPEAVAAIKAKAAEMIEGITRFIDSMMTSFRAIPGQMAEIGRQIINGLWEGIQSQWASVQEKVTAIASGIKDKFTGFFDIHSPSRVMMDVGSYIMQGLQNGMTLEKGAVVSAAGDIAGSVKDSFSSIESIGKMASDAFSQLADGLVDVAFNGGSALDVLKDIGQQLASAALRSVLSPLGGAFNFLPARAEGGPVSSGSPYLVGERGYEVFQPGRSGRIINHSDVQDIMGSQSGGRGGGLSIGSIQFTTRDMDSFRSSEAELTGQLSRMLARAQRFE